MYKLFDLFFVLKKGAEYTAEWAIVPVGRADYYTFVNAARRMLEAALRDQLAVLSGPVDEIDCRFVVGLDAST